MAIGLSLLMSAAVMLSAGGWFRVQGPSKETEVAVQGNPEYLPSVAGIYGQLQLLPQLEKQMLANAGVPEKANAYQRRRNDARRRIDELIVKARGAAASGAEHKRLDQLVAMAARADARYEQVLAAIARRQVALPLASNSD